MGGPDAASLKPLTTVGKSGFETAIPLSQSLRTYEVQAVDGSGHVLGTSRPFGVGG
jgi:hypothetical protein